MHSIAVAALLVLPALVFWPGARDAFLAPPWAVAGALAAAGCVAGVFRGAPGWTALPRQWRWLAAGWLGWLAVRIPGSADPWLGAVTMGEWLIVLAAALAGSGLPERERRRIVTLVALAAAVVSLLALAEFGTGRFPLFPAAAPTTAMPGRPGSTLGNPVFLGGWLAAALPVLLAGTGRIPAAAGVLAVGTLVLTGSRGALLAAAAGVAWTASRHPALRSRAVRAAAGAAVAVVLLAALRPATLAHLGTPALAGRADTWMTTLGMIRTAPLLGVGTGGFGAAYPCARIVRSAADPGLDGWHSTLFAHQEYLHALAETGPVGLGLLLGWLVAVLRTRPAGAAGGAAQGGVVALAVAGLSAFPLHLPATGLWWWMLPAIWLTDPGSRRPATSRSGMAAAALLAFAAAWLPARLLVRSAEFRSGLAAQEAGAFADADARFGAALRVLPDTARDRIGLNRAIAKFRAGELGEAEALLDADEARFPCTAEATWYRAFIGVMRVAAGQREAARVAELRITDGLGLRPPPARAAGFWTLRGHLRAALGDRSGARQAYRAALELDPASRDARSNLARFSGR